VIILLSRVCSSNFALRGF